MKNLRGIRILIALIIFVLLSLAFIGIPTFSPSTKIIDFITYLQFIPSVVKFTIALSAIGFIIVLLLTLLVGRVYCSTICPLGILQDIFSRLGKRIRKVKIYRYARPMNWLRYGLTILIIVSILFSGIFLLAWFDPYSNFGKIISGIIRPILIALNDSLSKVFEAANMLIIPPVGIKNIGWANVLFPSVILLVVGYLALFRGRLFCNTICPVGTVLSVVSRFSIFKLQINKTSCTQCGKCSSNCKSQCIDIKSQTIDFDRCVACYNCIQVCSENAISYTNQIGSKAEINADKKLTYNSERRNFISALTGSIIGAELIYAARARANENSNHINHLVINKKYPVSPPGSLNREHFISHCTACHLCVSQCPTHVLRPSFLEYGFTGMLMPYLNYNESFCNYECVQCSEVCPTGAILPITVEAKKTLQIGKVIFVKENCIVTIKETSCGACAEHCPTAAVHMVPYKNDLRIPATNQEVCIGCGACEYACPAKPHKAIYVEGNEVHALAQKPKEENLKEEIPEEFPF